MILPLTIRAALSLFAMRATKFLAAMASIFCLDGGWGWGVGSNRSHLVARPRPVQQRPFPPVDAPPSPALLLVIYFVDPPLQQCLQTKPEGAEHVDGLDGGGARVRVRGEDVV